MDQTKETPKEQPEIVAATPVSTSDDTVLAAVATIPLVGLIIYLAMKDASPLVKHYAKQSNFLLALSVLNIVISSVLSFVLIGFCTGPVLGLLGLVVWIVYVIKALQGEKYMTPVVGEFFDQMM